MRQIFPSVFDYLLPPYWIPKLKKQKMNENGSGVRKCIVPSINYSEDLITSVA